MKKSKILIIILILIIIFELIWIIYTNITNPNWNNAKILIKDNILTSTGATVIIKNPAKQAIDDYNIYKKNGDRWERLDTIEGYDDIAIARLDTDIKRNYEENLDWSKKYGELEPGTYRIDLEFNDNENNTRYSRVISVEFLLS